MKPDWDQAPDWANWLAMDGAGSWYWHEERPEEGHDVWLSTGRMKRVCTPFWNQTLEERLGQSFAQKGDIP